MGKLLKTCSRINIAVEEKRSQVENPTIQLKPQSGKQEQFYNCDADIAFFGGAAGSGKSSVLLIDFAKPEYLENPDYGCVIFRRTCPQITNQGGLWDESSKFYAGLNGKPKLDNLSWKFESGATVRFAHLQHEKNIYDWQGSQIARIGWDELTHFTEEMFFYLLSRNRTMSGVPPQIRATMNPDAESWVAKLIEWWIDVDGYPIPERSGVKRYFVRVNSELIWGDSKEELEDVFNDAWEKAIAELKERITLPQELLEEVENLIEPKSFTFISGTIFDNPALIRANPQYLVNLLSLHPVEQARLLKGNWKARYEAGKVFNRSWFKHLPALPSVSEYRLVKTVRFWDLAATSATTATNTSFYTAGIRMSKWRHLITNKYLYVVEDQIAEQVAAGEVPNLMMRTAHFDGEDVLVRWELEGGASALILEQKISDSLPLHDAFAVKPLGNKVTRALPYATAAHNGIVYLLDNDWNSVYLNCVQGFDGSKKPLINDIVDASSGAYSELEGMSAEELNSAWIS